MRAMTNFITSMGNTSSITNVFASNIVLDYESNSDYYYKEFEVDARSVSHLAWDNDNARAGGSSEYSSGSNTSVIPCKVKFKIELDVAHDEYGNDEYVSLSGTAEHITKYDIGNGTMMDNRFILSFDLPRLNASTDHLPPPPSLE